MTRAWRWDSVLLCDCTSTQEAPLFVVLIHSQKGGSGRSTMAINLAVEATRGGLKTLIIDLDAQCTAMSWADSREAPEPQALSITPNRLAKAIQTAREAGIKLTIIDTAPHSSDAAIMAAEMSDLILIPCRPAVFDLRSLANTARIVKLADKPAFVLLTQCPHAPRQIEQAQDAVRQFGLQLAPTVIYQRAAIAHASTLGLAASEYDPGSKAALDIASLYAWLSDKITAAHKPKSTGARLHRRTSAQLEAGR